MLNKVCLLLLGVGVYAAYAGSSSESKIEDELFGQLDFIFPDNFLSKYPEESEFFTMKIFVYLFFNIFAKYLGKNEPIKFWSKFNHNDFNRVAIDAAFYEYLAKFADRKMKNLIFNPLESSTSGPEDIVIDRIGDYLDNLSTSEAPTDESKAPSQANTMKDYKHRGTKCSEISVHAPTSGIPGQDFPNYCDIPQTYFTCVNKLVPGIYADIETRCQVFHVCWPRRIDSYLCPIGTTFNQALLTCDFWHESDCYSSPLYFDHSLFARGQDQSNMEPTISMDETVTTSESHLAPESGIPEFDETCQSLMNEPLQLRMKFIPAKCKTTYLKRRTPWAASDSIKYNRKRFDRLMADILFENIREMLLSIIKPAEFGSRMQRNAQRPEMKMEWPNPKLDSKLVRVTSEPPLKDGDDEIKEQIYPLTTEMPPDNQEELSQRINSKFIEKSFFKESSQGKVAYIHSVRKSALLKPSKPSEDSIKRVFDTMSKSLELGGRILNDDLLPFVEKIALESHGQKSKS